MIGTHAPEIQTAPSIRGILITEHFVSETLIRRSASWKQE